MTPTIGRGASRGNPRFSQPRAAALSGQEHAHESPTQRINRDANSDAPSLAILAW